MSTEARKSEGGRKPEGQCLTGANQGSAPEWGNTPHAAGRPIQGSERPPGDRPGA